MTRKHSLDKFSDEEKQKLADMQEQFKAAQKEEPTNLREHLQAFNDGVIAHHHYDHCVGNTTSYQRGSLSRILK